MDHKITILFIQKLYIYCTQKVAHCLEFIKLIEEYNLSKS